MRTIAALVTCHNRKEKTRRCLEALFKSEELNSLGVHVYLVDDGSTDGTTELLSSLFSDITIISGDGSLFWNRGMYTAFKEASKKNFDFYLWLNDDTFIVSNALKVLLETWENCCQLHKHEKHIIIGTTCDPDDPGKATYGGVRKKRGLHPFRYDLIFPDGNLQYADTMNGNIVLIPRDIYMSIGNLDFTFSHSMGDLDYGYRAKKAGSNLVVASAILGRCSRNSSDADGKIDTLSFKQKVRKKLSKKGLPFKDWKYFCFRNGGILWPLWTISPYVTFILQELFFKRARK